MDDDTFLAEQMAYTGSARPITTGPMRNAKTYGNCCPSSMNSRLPVEWSVRIRPVAGHFIRVAEPPTAPGPG